MNDQFLGVSLPLIIIKMKKAILSKGYQTVLFFAVVLLCFGSCSPEDGYYQTANVSQGTSLNTYDYLKSKVGVYDSLLFVIDKLGMQKAVRDSGVTVFAVSNEGFQIAIKNLNDVRRGQGRNSIYLADIVKGAKGVAAKDIGKAKADSLNLDTLVSKYIIKGVYNSGDFALGDGQTVKSIHGEFPMHAKRVFSDAQGNENGGSEIIEFSNTKRSLFVANWESSTTTSVNIKTKNGMVHLLQSDHVFGFNEFVRRMTFIPPPENLFLRGGNKYFLHYEDPAFEANPIVNDVNERFEKLFDNNLATKWTYNGFNNISKRFTMFWRAPEPTVANSYTLVSANDVPNRDPKAWRLEASNDSTAWVILDTRQEIKFDQRYQRRVFDFENETAYKWYRLFMVQNAGEQFFQAAEWTMNFRTIYK